MNNERIKSFLDELLGGYEQTPSLLEQKEELLIHLTERVQDHMAKGLTYDEAFNATIKDLGDVNELVAGIAPAKEGHFPEHSSHKKGKKKGKKKNKNKKNAFKRIWLPLTSMSPFIYLILGIIFGWWAWAWVIIPLCGILVTGDKRVIIASASPFIYFLLGYFFGWWAWGWLIIPMSGVLFLIDDD